MQKSRNIFGIHKNGYVFRKKTIEADEEYLNEFDFRLNAGNLKNPTMYALEKLVEDCWFPCPRRFIGIPCV